MSIISEPSTLGYGSGCTTYPLSFKFGEKKSLYRFPLPYSFKKNHVNNNQGPMNKKNP
jgi:hypothetical protein